MKKYINLIFFVGILLSISLLSGCRGGEQIRYSVGAISGAGFEDGVLDDHWYAVGADGSVIVDNTHAFDGNGSLRVGSDTDYTASVTQYVSGLEAGYYYLEAYVRNDGDQSYCYLYGKGTNQGKCTTAAPRSETESAAKARAKSFFIFIIPYIL